MLKDFRIFHKPDSGGDGGSDQTIDKKNPNAEEHLDDSIEDSKKETTEDATINSTDDSTEDATVNSTDDSTDGSSNQTTDSVPTVPQSNAPVPPTPQASAPVVTVPTDPILIEAAQISSNIFEIFDNVFQARQSQEFLLFSEDEKQRLPSISKKLLEMEQESCTKSFEFVKDYFKRISEIFEGNGIYVHSSKYLTQIFNFSEPDIDLGEICEFLKIYKAIKNQDKDINFKPLINYSKKDLEKLLKNIHNFLKFINKKPTFTDPDTKITKKLNISEYSQSILTSQIEYFEKPIVNQITVKQRAEKMSDNLRIKLKPEDFNPEDTKIIEKLKLISYLEAIVNHADQLASAIKDLIELSFSTEPNKIAEFDKRISEGLNILNQMYSTGNTEVLNKRYGHLVNVPDAAERKKRIQQDLIESLRYLEKLLKLIEALLLESKLDTILVPENSSYSYDSAITDKTKREPLDFQFWGSMSDALDPNNNFRFLILCRAKEYFSKEKNKPRRNQARIKFEGLLKGLLGATRGSVRIDFPEASSEVALDLDVPCGFFIKQQDPNAEHTHHHFIEDQLSQNQLDIKVPEIPVIISKENFEAIVLLFEHELSKIWPMVLEYGDNPKTIVKNN